MDDTQSIPDDHAGQQADDPGHDQDSEPTLNAPEEGRPDGLGALIDHEDEEDESTGGDGTPS